jgi:hypothetical protein
MCIAAEDAAVLTDVKMGLWKKINGKSVVIKKTCLDGK